MQEITYLDNDSKIIDLINLVTQNLDQHPYACVDTEFMLDECEKNFLCLIQFFFNNQIFIIDPFKINLLLLNDIFNNPNLLKIFHSKNNDVSILKQNSIKICNVYDTQIGEHLLSTRHQISYEALVFKYLKKHISKQLQISNWSKRPLAKKQLEYAAIDVLYLNECFLLQRQKLTNLNRLHIAINEANEAPAETEKNTIFGNNLENSKAQNDEVKTEQIKPDETKNNENSTEAEKNNIEKNDAGNLLKNQNRQSSNYADEVFFILKAILNYISKKEKIAQQLIASSHDLEMLLTDKDNKCLHNWRFDIFGKIALDVLNGRQFPCVKCNINGKYELCLKEKTELIN